MAGLILWDLLAMEPAKGMSQTVEKVAVLMGPSGNNVKTVRGTEWGVKPLIRTVSYRVPEEIGKESERDSEPSSSSWDTCAVSHKKCPVLPPPLEESRKLEEDGDVLEDPEVFKRVAHKPQMSDGRNPSSGSASSLYVLEWLKVLPEEFSLLTCATEEEFWDLPYANQEETGQNSLRDKI